MCSANPGAAPAWVDDLVTEASRHPRPADLTVIEGLIVRRLEQPELAGILSYLDGVWLPSLPASSVRSAITSPVCAARRATCRRSSGFSCFPRSIRCGGAG